MKILMPLFLILFTFLSVLGQTEMDKDTIDVQLAECLDSTENQTTYGMIQCSIRAGEAWDMELNKYYQLLMQTLSADEKGKLINSQKKWIIYRDSEIEFARTIYNNQQGTMWRIVSADRQTEITKLRALELKQYLANMPEVD
jgi:uncharacterized protein YecT (DUF1311 family)